MGSDERPNVVLALPRGGVVVGAEVARQLGVPMDLVLARKVGHPAHPEYAIAAVTDDGFLLKNDAECREVDEAWLSEEVGRQTAEAARRRERYLRSRANFRLEELDVLLADDGLATGLTMLAAIGSVRARKPKRIVVAVPVAPSDTLARIDQSADRAIAVLVPSPFVGAVGAYYRDFTQTTDDEVLAALESLAAPGAAEPPRGYQ